MAWHDGRTFYACPCGWRDERTGDDAPASLPCGCDGSMAQWVPPAVARDRASPSTGIPVDPGAAGDRARAEGQLGVAEPIGTLI